MTEKFPQKKYKSLKPVRDQDDEIVGMESSNDETVNTGRRQFLKGFALGAGAVATPNILKDIFFEKEPQTDNEQKNEQIENKETMLADKPIVDQLSEFGEIKDLHLAINAEFKKHYQHLTENKKGQVDMERSFQNLNKLNLTKFVTPFVERGLPPYLACMIAVQETRARVMDSWAGARGITGVMPATAKAYGLNPEDVNDPYKASFVSAKYIVDEKQRFGEDVHMLAHAYNGGGGLFGFTAATPKVDRTPENFYVYMQHYINEKYKRAVKNGFYEYVVKKGDTLTSIAKNMKVPLDSLVEVNEKADDQIIKIDEKLKIPFQGSRSDIERYFRKELEVLRYTPELLAKYKALKDMGYLQQIEAKYSDETQKA